MSGQCLTLFISEQRASDKPVPEEWNVEKTLNCLNQSNTEIRLTEVHARPQSKRSGEARMFRLHNNDFDCARESRPSKRHFRPAPDSRRSSDVFHRLDIV